MKKINEYELAKMMRDIDLWDDGQKDNFYKIWKSEHPNVYEKAILIKNSDEKPGYEGMVGDIELDKDKLGFKNTLYYPVQRVILEKIKSRSLERIANTTTNILKALEVSKKGLVFGQVQSGKTTHFTYLIAKAFSIDYDAVIVLSGMNNDLRAQTQLRLEKDLTGSNFKRENYDNLNIDFTANKNEIDFLTDESDINKKHIPTNIKYSTKKMVAVIKKNKSSFKSIDKILKLLEGNKVLLIDDEADSGTINTKRDKVKDKSAYNKWINSLVSDYSLKYLAYTATPFANFLINEAADPNLKAQFIQYLGNPHGYVGYNQYFPINDNSPIAPIISFEGYNIKKESTFQERTFEDLIYLFMIDIICRNLKKATLGINITHYTKHHEDIKDAIASTLERIETLAFQKYNKKNTEIHIKTNKALDSLGYDSIPVGKEKDFFAKMRTLYWKLSENIYTANKDNVFDGEFKNEFNILIGGYKLGRGITIPNLTFYCLDRTSKEYDVILQQARFFGYRKSSPVLYISDENLEKFNDIVLPLDSLINQLIYASTSDTVKGIFLDQVSKFRITSNSKSGKLEYVDRLSEDYLGNNIPFNKGLISDWKNRNKQIDSLIKNAKKILPENKEINSEGTILRPYGRGDLYKTSTKELISLFKKLKGQEFKDEFVDRLEEILNNSEIKEGYIFIPNGKSKSLSNILGKNRREGMVVSSGNKYFSSSAIQKSDYIGDGNRKKEKFSIQRSSKDFLLSFNQQKYVKGEIDPIFMSLEIGGGVTNAQKTGRKKSVLVNIGSVI